MVILEKFRKKYQILTNNEEEILVTTFYCRLKGEMGIVLHLNRTGPTVISDAGLITRVEFAALPKFYTDNSSIIQNVWMEVVVLVCSKLTLWSQTHVLIWRC
jgi:hypothetical protein